MPEPAIRLEGVSKEYRIRHQLDGPQMSFKALLNTPFRQLMRRSGGRNQLEPFFAVRNVSFEIKRGESVALIGRNGAGKSTILKMLARIVRPSEGRITLFGQVSSLLEIGTGFSGQLSGRENIYLNGSFLGMRTAEIKQKFDEIVAFSEIEEFIDTPVKYYSSGMFVRLAFSVAVHLTPEILLLDEVISVGDSGFQQKSQAKMRELLASGATILLVSHNDKAVREICHRALWMDRGILRMDGSSAHVVEQYLNFVRQASA